MFACQICEAHSCTVHVFVQYVLIPSFDDVKIICDAGRIQMLLEILKLAPVTQALSSWVFGSYDALQNVFFECCKVA